MTRRSLAEQAIYSTIKLTAYKNGAPISTGTGFFYHFVQTETSNCPAIVTNKHVVSGADQILATCHIEDSERGPSGSYIDFKIPINPASTIHHPNPDVDLCAIAISPALMKAQENGTPVFFTALNASVIPADDEWQHYDAIESVTMIGCPNGISDEANNLPIARRGITASSLARNYNGKSEFVVDMACFPGSSGSPVFVLDQNGFFDRKSERYMMGGSRIKLVGILYAGPLISQSGKIILAQPPKVEIAAMMHLGYCIKSTQLEAIDSIFKKLSENE